MISLCKSLVILMIFNLKLCFQLYIKKYSMFYLVIMQKISLSLAQDG